VVVYKVASLTVCQGDTADEVAVTLVLPLCRVLCFKIATGVIWGQVTYGVCCRLEMRVNIYLVVIK
jgi:hypothetical protein